MPTLAQAQPYPIAFEVATTALLLIDMQRDFLEPGGFGEMLGNDVSRLRTTMRPVSACSRPPVNRACAFCIRAKVIARI